MKRLIVLMLLLILPLSMLAQVSNIIEHRRHISDVLEPLDKQEIQTGLLSDHAIDYVDLDMYDGKEVNDTNYVDRLIYLDILRSIRSAAVQDSPIGPIAGVADVWQSLYGDGEMPVSYALYKYDYISRRSLESNFFQIIDGKIHVNTIQTRGGTIYPYSQEHVVGFSPALNICSPGSMTFTFPSQLGFTNETITKIEFDPGLGSGYGVILPNASCEVIYPEGDYKVDLKMRFTLADGTLLTSHSPMYVLSHSQEAETTSPDILQQHFESSTPYQGITTSAEVQIKYASGRTSIQKPLIVAEGFDPLEFAELINGEDSDNGLGSNDLDNSDYSGFSDYDIIYVNWNDSDQYIQANANLLIDIIEWVNANKADNAEKNIVYGESMGGLVARYALCKMEEEGRPHDTDIYVSYDSPHLGANVPLGALYMLNDVSSFIATALQDEDVTELLGYEEIDPQQLQVIDKYLNAPSVKQMLINYVDESGELNNTVHNQWQNELAAIGFPEGDPGNKMIRLAVSNGGETDIASVTDFINLEVEGYALFPLFCLSLDKLFTISGYPLFELFMTYVASKVGLGTFLPGKLTLTALFNVKPYISNNSQIYNGQINFKKKCWLLPAYETSLYSNIEYSPASGIPVDNLPGSYYDTSLPSLDIDGQDFSWWIIDYAGYDFLDTMITDKIMFIPTASSLCYGKDNATLTSTDYYRNFYALRNDQLDIPFHGIVLEETPSYHTNNMSSDDSLVSEWISMHRKFSISGPMVPSTGDTYRVYGLVPYVEWSTSDESILSINPNTGQVTAVSSGEVDIYAKYIHEGYTVTLAKTVFVGFPEIYLEKYEGDYTYGVSAKCANPELESHLSSFTFKWASVDRCLEHPKSLNQTLVWTTTSEPVYDLGVPHSENGWNVYLKLVDQDGNESPVYNVIVNPELKYSVSPAVIIVNDSGQIFFRSSDDVVSYGNFYRPLIVAERQEGMPAIQKIRIIMTESILPFFREVTASKFLDFDYTFNFTDLGVQSALNNQLLPNGTSSRIVWDFILISTEGEIVQKFPFMMLYDADYSPVIDSGPVFLP